MNNLFQKLYILTLWFINLYFFCQAVFERLRNVLHESDTEKRVQYMIEVMFAVRKDGFKVLSFLCSTLYKKMGFGTLPSPSFLPFTLHIATILFYSYFSTRYPRLLE